MSSHVCPCGQAMSQHAPSVPPTPLYRLARLAIRRAISQVVYLPPDVPESYRRAIARARAERTEVGA